MRHRDGGRKKDFPCINVNLSYPLGLYCQKKNLREEKRCEGCHLYHFLAHQIKKSDVLSCVKKFLILHKLFYTRPTSCFLTLVV